MSLSPPRTTRVGRSRQSICSHKRGGVVLARQLPVRRPEHLVVLPGPLAVRQLLEVVHYAAPDLLRRPEGVILLYPLHEGVYRVQHVVALDEPAHPVRARPLHGGKRKSTTTNALTRPGWFAAYEIAFRPPMERPMSTKSLRSSASVTAWRSVQYASRRVVTVRRPVGVAVAALVQRQDAEPVAHRQRDEVPRVAGLGITRGAATWEGYRARPHSR